MFTGGAIWILTHGHIDPWEAIPGLPKQIPGDRGAPSTPGPQSAGPLEGGKLLWDSLGILVGVSFCWGSFWFPILFCFDFDLE